MSGREGRRHVTRLSRGGSLAAVLMAGCLVLASVTGAALAAQPDLRLITMIQVGPAPGQVAADPSTNTIYALDYPNGTVSVISGATNQVTATIDISHPISLAVNPATNTIYVSNRYRHMFVISGATNRVTATIDTGYVASIAADPATGMIYASGIHGVLVINGTTNQVVARIGGVPLAELAVDTATNVIYAGGIVSASGVYPPSYAVKVISGPSNRITGTVPIDGELTGLDVNPSTDTVYASHLSSQAVQHGVEVINGQTDTVTARIWLQKYPWGVAVDPASNAIYVTIANMNGPNPVNLVLKVDGTSNTVVASAAAGNTPEAIAVNPATDTIYAADSDGTTIAVLHG